MGIDSKKLHKKKSVRTHPKSKDVYLNLLVRLYKFLSRRTQHNINKVIHKRLCMSRVNRPPINLRQIIARANKNPNTTIVVVGTVTDDTRILRVPANLSIAALHFTEGARKRILSHGGEVLTLDQLALRKPLGSGAQLMRGPKNARKATRYFGITGSPGSHVRPRVSGKGKERARGRRTSCGFKV